MKELREPPLPIEVDESFKVMAQGIADGDVELNLGETRLFLLVTVDNLMKQLAWRNEMISWMLDLHKFLRQLERRIDAR